MENNLPARQDTWLQYLGWEDPLENWMATHSNILAWRIPWQVTVHRVAKSQTQLSNQHFTFGFPGNSDSKDSACNARGRVQPLSPGDHLEKGMVTHSSIVAWRIHGWRSLAGHSSWGNKESDTPEWLTFSLSSLQKI